MYLTSTKDMFIMKVRWYSDHYKFHGESDFTREKIQFPLMDLLIKTSSTKQKVLVSFRV